MNTLDFINSMTANIAWPVTVITLAHVLHAPLSKLMLALKKVKVKDVEMHFGETMEEIKKDVKKKKSEVVDWKVTDEEYLEPNMLALAEKSPLGVVLQSWDIFESFIKKLAELGSGQTFNDMASAVVWINDNDKGSKVTNFYYRFFAMKTQFLNFEGEELSKEEALEFSNVILYLVRVVQADWKEKGLAV